MFMRYSPSYLHSLIVEVCSKHSCSRKRTKFSWSFAFKFRTVDKWCVLIGSKRTCPQCLEKFTQRLTSKVNTYHVPGCNASCRYDRWCRKHGFLNHSNSVGRFVFFPLILPYFPSSFKRIYSVIMLSMNSSFWSYFLVLFSTELRKKARQLENEIDLKLVSFSKLGTNYSHRDGFKERYSFFEMKRHGFYHLRIWLVISVFCLQFWYVTTFKQFFEWTTFRNYGTRNWTTVIQG